MKPSSESSPVAVKMESEESIDMDVDSSDNDYEVVLDKDGDEFLKVSR
jgi:hypothetical protein